MSIYGMILVSKLKNQFFQCLEQSMLLWIQIDSLCPGISIKIDCSSGFRSIHVALDSVSTSISIIYRNR